MLLWSPVLRLYYETLMTLMKFPDFRGGLRRDALQESIAQAIYCLCNVIAVDYWMFMPVLTLG